ncbi:MAG: hypothetical protein E6H06_17595 [Bacteroidetes bacterium]|nr:MAG: hypothetical protein E6H06_17595 [Bacteroidota bacterium]
MKITSAIKRISVGIALVAGLAACKKSTDLILSPDQLAVGSYLIEDSQGNDTLFLNSQSTPVVFSVHAYGEQVDKVTVYVSTNNSIDKTTWKKVKEFPVDATQKVTLSVTPAQIAAALGTPIPNGAAYTLYNEATTKSGATYSLANMNTDFEAAPDYHMGMRWNVFAPCLWDNSPFTGQFTVITDTWQDYSPGEKVDVRPGPGANQIQISVYPSDAYGFNRQWVTIDVNPVTLATNITEQFVGTYYPSDDATMYSSTGTVNPCQKTIDIPGITFNFSGTKYSGYHLTLRQF